MLLTLTHISGQNCRLVLPSLPLHHCHRVSQHFTACCQLFFAGGSVDSAQLGYGKANYSLRCELFEQHTCHECHCAQRNQHRRQREQHGARIWAQHWQLLWVLHHGCDTEWEWARVLYHTHTTTNNNRYMRTMEELSEHTCLLWEPYRVLHDPIPIHIRSHSSLLSKPYSWLVCKLLNNNVSCRRC